MIHNVTILFGNCAAQKDANVRFDDLTGTIFTGDNQPLKVWILCLYFMGLKVPNEQIAKELDLNCTNVQKMTTQLHEGVVKKMRWGLHCVSAERKNSEVVAHKEREGRRSRLKVARGRSTLEIEKPSVFGIFSDTAWLYFRCLPIFQI